MSIREAARRLGRNPYSVRIALAGLGIEPQRVGNVLVVTARDFDRVRARLERHKPATTAAH